MFSGIVEETGQVISFTEGPRSWELVLAAKKATEGVMQGDSIAVNGCCLTVIEVAPGRLVFDLLGETVRLTSFDGLQAGQLVNLERSLQIGGTLGGHFVTGHIDTTAKVTLFEPRGKDYYLRVEPPAEFLRYVVYKGSVALDGISLTVAAVDATGLAVWLIPHTLTVTNLQERKAGDLINIEFDVLAKYVEKIVAGGREVERSE